MPGGLGDGLTCAAAGDPLGADVAVAVGDAVPVGPGSAVGRGVAINAITAKPAAIAAIAASTTAATSLFDRLTDRTLRHRTYVALPVAYSGAVLLSTVMRSVRVLTALMALAIAACTAPTHQAPEATGERVLPGDPLSAAVNKYFHYRKLAIIARDPELILSRYPDLRTGTDVGKGINREGSTMVPDSGSLLVDIMYDLDRYEPLHVRHVGDVAIVRVHGLELYIEADFSDGTAGEFTIDFI